MNLSLFAYTLLPVFFSLGRETWPALPFLCLFPAGFLLIIACDFQECLRSLHQALRNQAHPKK
ncbi:MAG: hypothetical protein ABIK15_01665 [Pseudomonadota bacterium]